MRFHEGSGVASSCFLRGNVTNRGSASSGGVEYLAAALRRAGCRKVLYLWKLAQILRTSTRAPCAKFQCVTKIISGRSGAARRRGVHSLIVAGHDTLSPDASEENDGERQ